MLRLVRPVCRPAYRAAGIAAHEQHGVGTRNKQKGCMTRPNRTAYEVICHTGGGGR